MVICSMHLWEALILLMSEIKLSESEAVAVLPVAPHPPPLRNVATPTSVAFFKTGRELTAAETGFHDPLTPFGEDFSLQLCRLVTHLYYRLYYTLKGKVKAKKGKK